MKALAILGVTLLTLTARATTTTFTDNTFNLAANYSETAVFTTSSSDSVTFDQCATCGNPGQALQIQMNLPTAGDFASIGFINNGFVYNPATQGAISSIDASVDKDIITNLPVNPSAPPFNNTFRPTIEQDGLFYEAPIAGPGYQGGTTGYNTISHTGLVATDFIQFDFATGTFGSGHPDFGGHQMLFGLTQITQFLGTPVKFEADYDNLNLTIRSVPDSGDTIVLLLGSVGALLVLERTMRYLQTSA
jgi:hypothetical protein